MRVLLLLRSLIFLGCSLSLLRVCGLIRVIFWGIL